MAGRCWHADARVGASNSASVPRGSLRILARGSSGFPKSVRLLSSKDFRKVYDQGTRYSCAFFAAFCLQDSGGAGPRIGFTTPRALGKAVVRNRIRRRVREVVRHRLDRLNSPWSIVINPRRKALDCSLQEIQREIDRLFLRCNG